MLIPWVVGTDQNFHTPFMVRRIVYSARYFTVDTHVFAREMCLHFLNLPDLSRRPTGTVVL